MSLEKRIKGFDRLGSRFQHKRLDKVLIGYKIPDELFRRFQIAAASYVSRCLPGEQFTEHEDELLRRIEKYYKEMPNITPNGLVVPKRHLVIEYNALISAYASIIDSCGINDLISSWHVPLNLRIKLGEADAFNMTRHHPTEYPHSDSWAGESSESVTTHIPIFGDFERNHLAFFSPPDDFKEEWMGYLPSYKDGKEIADRYTKLEAKPKKGHLYFADFAGLHSSYRLPNAGPRVTIDTTFVLNRPEPILGTEHPWRENERATHDIFSSLGSEKLFYFPDSNEEFVDSEGGFKHPTNLHVLDLGIKDE